MANFDLTAYRNSKMNAYAKRKDEIGIIASALVGMHENFTELVHRISEMDAEIKQIDIREDTSYRLTLSDKNPFHNATQSINVLLEKTQSYLEQLKESNREILEKNELLTASVEASFSKNYFRP
ncbi:hypothetical protein SAMN02745975_03441 [Geosporobacter subterraneus DSM 17957]|uniref:Methyl-accepting chemotaxis protein n=1 Tax=Geosporobacter subterraneus DSM 17957 TaxID=1121919 RepID=A0A1M6NZ88_9FIRM|nr:hypothetical protein [Geosporobacter subterraneus]SHK00942.1 hypothetical protein SAMN02745975_03441 [Geosporobacter subterraneus DSM 17957]